MSAESIRTVVIKISCAEMTQITRAKVSHHCVLSTTHKNPHTQVTVLRSFQSEMQNRLLALNLVFSEQGYGVSRVMSKFLFVPLHPIYPELKNSKFFFLIQCRPQDLDMKTSQQSQMPYAPETQIEGACERASLPEGKFIEVSLGLFPCFFFVY